MYRPLPALLNPVLFAAYVPAFADDASHWRIYYGDPNNDTSTQTWKNVTLVSARNDDRHVFDTLADLVEWWQWNRYGGLFLYAPTNGAVALLPAHGTDQARAQAITLETHDTDLGRPSGYRETIYL